MQIRLASDIQRDSIVDGEGIRTVLWTQGCPHHCPGCHNPETHDFEGGALIDVDEVISELKKTPLGVNLNHIFLLCVPINQDNLRKYHHMFYQNYVCTMDRQYHEDYL